MHGRFQGRRGSRSPALDAYRSERGLTRVAKTVRPKATGLHTTRSSCQGGSSGADRTAVRWQGAEGSFPADNLARLGRAAFTLSTRRPPKATVLPPGCAGANPRRPRSIYKATVFSTSVSTVLPAAVPSQLAQSVGRTCRVGVGPPQRPRPDSPGPALLAAARLPARAVSSRRAARGRRGFAPAQPVPGRVQATPHWPVIGSEGDSYARQRRSQGPLLDAEPSARGCPRG